MGLLYVRLLGYFVTFILSIGQADALTYTRASSFYDTLPAAPVGGTLRLSINSDPRVMNPVLSNDMASVSVEGFLWIPLMVRDTESLRALPGLANGYEITNNRYRFFLNPKAKWDDGTAVTADDVVFTLDLIMNPAVNAAVQRAYYQGWQAKKVDAHTVEFSISKPQFDTLFQLQGFRPIQKKQFVASKDFNKDKGIMNPVGNGPYRFIQYSRGQSILFQRNAGWWGFQEAHFKNRYHMEKIQLNIITAPDLAYERWLQGFLDIISFTPEQWGLKVLGTDKNRIGENDKTTQKVWAFQGENRAPQGYSFIGWNGKNPLFQSAKTRTALSYLVDYDRISKVVFYDLTIQTTSPFGSLSLNSDQSLRSREKMISFDRKKAMSLFKEDGWTIQKGQLVKIIGGKTVPLRFSLDVATQSTTGLKIAQILKEDFKKLGIEMNIRSLEWNTFLANLNQRNFEAVMLGWSATLFPNPRQLWATTSAADGGSNFVSYSNPQVDVLIEQANQELDPEKRYYIMRKINAFIYDDQPYTFLTEPRYLLRGISTHMGASRWITTYGDAADADFVYLKSGL